MKQRVNAFYKKLRATNIIANFFNLSSIQISNILLLLLTTRLVTGRIGIEGFGLVIFAYRCSMFAGAIINYGTGQSGIRDTAYNLTDTKKLSALFYSVLLVRGFIFALFLIGLLNFYWFNINSNTYILLAMPVALAEVFNPLCFFIGIEKLKLFNIYNMIANIIAFLTILFFIKGPDEACWVNFILGMANVITYVGLLIYFAVSYKLPFYIPLKTELLTIGKDNFYLTVNNVSANLQQSIIIFALNWDNSKLLGAYSLCDRIIGQIRNLLNTIANAIYPKAASIYKNSATMWGIYRRKTKLLLSAIFFVGAILIFSLANFIVYVLSKQHDVNAIMLLRTMAFVPVISAFNVFNMLDLLLKNNTVYIFRISTILVIVAVLVALTVADTGNHLLIGGFTFIIEISAWAMCEYVIKKPSIKNV